MPRKTIFSRQAVLEAGYAVLREQGLKGLTARNVAHKLRASVAPVYRSFSSMEGLRAEVVAHVKKQLLDYAARPYTELRFLDMGVGMCRFARDEPELFRAMFLERHDFKPVIDDILASLCARMREDEPFADMPEERRMALLTSMWIYTHGLAALIAVGVLEDDSDEYIVASLRSVGGVVSAAAVADFRRSRGETAFDAG